MILTVVFYIFVACAVIQLAYYLSFTTILFNNKKTDVIAEQPAISVLIFVKNSAKFLEENLPHFINQKYPNFEILLVNNESSDNTDELLEKLKKQYKTLRIINVENNESFWGNKKYTYTLAIKAAKYEHLLFSEINAKPISENWILEMSKQFSDEKSIVLGYKKSAKTTSFLSLLVRFENLLAFIKSFSFAKFGCAFSASQYNYGFTKSEFYRVKGFINHIKIRDGKDDLFVRDASNKKNITVTTHESSFIEVSENLNFKKWFYDKRKATILKKQYQFKSRFFLNAFFLTKALFYLLATFLFFFYPYPIMVLIVGGYFIIQFLVVGFAAKTFKEPTLIISLPFLEIILVLIQISIFFANLVSKPNHWK